jgi:hypothetical protein
MVAAGCLPSGSLSIRTQEGNESELGGRRSGKTKTLEAGAEMLQSETPALHTCTRLWLHFDNREPQRQVIVHHCCLAKGEIIHLE